MKIYIEIFTCFHCIRKDEENWYKISIPVKKSNEIIKKDNILPLFLVFPSIFHIFPWLWRISYWKLNKNCLDVIYYICFESISGIYLLTFGWNFLKRQLFLNTLLKLCFYWIFSCKLLSSMNFSIYSFRFSRLVSSWQQIYYSILYE